MDDSSDTAVVAIDGGGTRCRAAYDDGRTTVCVEAGPANVSTDFDGALHQIGRALDMLCERARLPQDAPTRVPAFVGLAGVTGPEIAARVSAALPFTLLRVTGDRPAALRGALGPDDGLVAHCGTGSFFGAQIGGAMRFAGGWGPVLGDEASAQWIGRAALRRALDSVDGLADSTPLAQRLLGDMGGAPGIVRFAGTARPEAFGALAPLVTEHAAQGDTLAREVMQAGAAEIARWLNELGWQPGMAICLTGGIGPYFRPWLPAPLRADVTPPRADPLTGAIALARDFAQELAHGRG